MIGDRALNPAWWGIAGLVLALTACDQQPETRVTRVGVNLGPCLGAIDMVGGDADMRVSPVPSTCRESLNSDIGDGAVNVCFVVRALDDATAPAQRLPLNWADGRISEPFDDRNIVLPPGQVITASLFFLAEGDETGDICEQFEVDTSCANTDACVLRLVEAEVVPDANGNTEFDFRREDGSCVSESGPSFTSGSVEVCDGMDNDCDQIIDEAIPGTAEACTVGVGACENSGSTVCDAAQGEIVCDVSPGQPAESEACPADDESCCDGSDDDCDGEIDEDISCSPCASDEECAENVAGAQCVEGRCEVCDPSDHQGCGETELCCGAGPDSFGCELTGFGPDEAEQCQACGEPCVVVRDRPDGAPLRVQNSDSCMGRACACGFGPACGEPAPFCIQGACVECRDNNDCGPQQLCCDGQCQVTDPEGQCTDCNTPCDLQIANRCIDRECFCGNSPECGGARATCLDSPACADDPDSPDCDPRDAQCEECLEDIDCSLVENRSACVERQCRECRTSDPQGGDAFCSNNPGAVADGRLQCVADDCVECDFRNHDGCAEDADEPFCDAETSTCRTCRDDAECNVRPGDRNQCVEGRCVACDPEDFAGCQDPARPVCDPGSLTCRTCTNGDAGDRECQTLGATLQCVGGLCTGCDPDDNIPCDPLGAAPVCDDESEACRGCLNDNECPSHPNDATDPDGNGPLAPANERPFCFLGQCSQCRPEDHVGCVEDGPRPFCAAGDCRPCERDAECATIPGDLDQCVDGGLCRFCDPADNAGCDDPANPVCDAQTFTCVPCGNDNQCNRGAAPGDPVIECVGGRCSECDPGRNQNNVGCDVDSDVPFCDPDGAFCRRCANPTECVSLDGERGLNVDRFGCVNGRCTECDPVTHNGCAETEVCDATGICRACTFDREDPINAAGDAECATRPDGRAQCVAGQCHVCDPADFAGCDPASDAPACDAATNTCQGCANDGQCREDGVRAANPIGEECVAGFCRACDPANGRSDGCDPRSAQPFCDDLFTCTGCGVGAVGDDSRCENNPVGELRQCVGDRCAECDPQTVDGCEEVGGEPICDAGSNTCRRCNNDAECFIRPGARNQCVAGECVVCDPDDDAGCNDPGAPVCDNNNRTCRPCQRDNECPGALLCVDGRCVECDGGDNRGCDVASATPFCDPGNSVCRPCTLVDGGNPDAECVDGDLAQCVNGNCTQCDPETHDGCDEAGGTPFCGADGVCRACANDAECVLRPGLANYCSAGQCVECNTGTNAGCGADTPVCDADNETCRRCRNSGECPGEQQCVDGRCEGCTPGSNAGCVLDSTAPFCEPGTLVCRACENDGECDGNDNGDQCYQGRCVECDPEVQEGCNIGSDTPFCGADGTCRACASDAQCELASNSRQQCVNGNCRECDNTTGTNDGCDLGSNEPFCPGNGSCRRCNNDNECNNNPNGGQCVNRFCVECDPSDNAGCDADGSNPICDDNSRTCRPCSENGGDRECRDANASGEQCVNGTCEVCDPATTDGCEEDGANPICDAGQQTCRACGNNAECSLRPGELDVCVNGQCAVCDPATSLGCDGDEPICANGQCRGCANDQECGPGVSCNNDGSCDACNTQTNAGCNQENPICDNGTRVCRPCRNDNECGAGFCVEGSCEVCDPDGHSGCGDQELCCLNAGQGIFGCEGTDPNSQCTQCGTACGDDGSNACTDRNCRCGPLNECAGQQNFCLGGAPAGVCSGCRDNDDCVANSTSPICGADLDGADVNDCRGCANDAECTGHPRGEQCIATPDDAERGACHVCDPANNDGCAAGSNQPVCDAGDYTCRGCNNDGDCAGNPNGGQCVAGACVECDPANDDGCDAASPTPVCDNRTNTCGCSTDNDCNGNPNGGECVNGQCAACDPAEVNAGQAGGGCNLNGNAPYCDPNSNTCVSCDNSDARCTNNPNGALCSGNSCVECLVGSNDGCNANELCCDDACVAANVNQCTACGTACGATADACTDRTCQCGGNAECAADEFCVNGACVNCQDNNDCNNGELCVENACQLCNPNNLNGCAANRADTCTGDECLCGVNPQCGGGEFCVGGECVECRNDGDCAGDPTGEQCVAGVCQECDSDNNDGCDDPASPICGNDSTCRGCANGQAGDDECAADADLGDYCTSGRCVVCSVDPNEGCPNGETCCFIVETLSIECRAMCP